MNKMDEKPHKKKNYKKIIIIIIIKFINLFQNKKLIK